MNILQGSYSGLTSAGSQSWTQNDIPGNVANPYEGLPVRRSPTALLRGRSIFYRVRRLGLPLLDINSGPGIN
ncbi:MAG: hypothetical protein AAGD25_15920 [Cyanobacteria bacterium P01_F01_bin.150]